MTTMALNHQPHGCLLNRLFRRRSKKTSKLCVTGLCVGNSPVPVNSPHKWSITRKSFHLMTSSWQKQISVIFKFDWLNRMVWPWSHRLKYIFLITPQSLEPQAGVRYLAFYTIPLHWQGPTYLTMGFLYIRFIYWTKDNQQNCSRLNNFAVLGVVYELLISCVVV